MNLNQSRRDFLKMLGTAGVIGVSTNLFPQWMPRMAFAQSQADVRGDVLVVIFLRGGIDGLSAIVPYGDGAHYYDARPTQRVGEPGSGSGAAIDLDGYFGMHPSFAPLADLYRANALAVVHATGLTDSTRSHFDAMQFMEYGLPGNRSVATGWIGRHLETAATRNESPFRAVGIGAIVPTSLRGSHVPLSLRSIADFHLRGRENELRAAQQTLMNLYSVEAPTNPLDAQARLVFDTVDMLQEISLAHYQPAHGAQYPNDDEGFGMGLQQVAQLIKADVGLEVACIDLGGWDTHENQGTHGGFFSTQLAVLAQGLNAFYTDVQDYMPNITVVTMSEFGRRIVENASAGTDHGHGNFMLLMGGGVNGGRVFADWPTLAPERLNEGDLAITTDYRDVLAEVLTQRLRNPSIEQIFPNFTHTPQGILIPRA